METVYSRLLHIHSNQSNRCTDILYKKNAHTLCHRMTCFHGTDIFCCTKALQDEIWQTLESTHPIIAPTTSLPMIFCWLPLRRESAFHADGQLCQWVANPIWGRMVTKAWVLWPEHVLLQLPPCQTSTHPRYTVGTLAHFPSQETFFVLPDTHSMPHD